MDQRARREGDSQRPLRGPGSLRGRHRVSDGKRKANSGEPDRLRSSHHMAQNGLPLPILDFKECVPSKPRGAEKRKRIDWLGDIPRLSSGQVRPPTAPIAKGRSKRIGGQLPLGHRRSRGWPVNRSAHLQRPAAAGTRAREHFEGSLSMARLFDKTYLACVPVSSECSSLPGLKRTALPGVMLTPNPVGCGRCRFFWRVR